MIGKLITYKGKTHEIIWVSVLYFDLKDIETNEIVQGVHISEIKK